MVSVIIPAFNSAKTIARAIDSVLAQEYDDLEIIVVDDGSTDSTGDVIKNYAGKVRYFYQANAGPAAARNKAIGLASGEWIAFLDADDQWLPEKLHKQMRLLEENPHLRWCCTNRYQASGTKKAEFSDTGRIRRALGQKQFFENYFDSANRGVCPIITTCLIIKKSVFDELGVFDPAYIRGEDLDMWWRASHRYPAIGFIAEPLAVRYLDAESPQAKELRIRLRGSDIGVKLLREHLVLARNDGSCDRFEKFAASQLKLCLSAMIFSGSARQALKASREFSRLLSPPWRMIIRLSAICPSLTAIMAKSAYNIMTLTIFKKNVIR